MLAGQIVEAMPVATLVLLMPQCEVHLLNRAARRLALRLAGQAAPGQSATHDAPTEHLMRWLEEIGALGAAAGVAVTGQAMHHVMEAVSLPGSHDLTAWTLDALPLDGLGNPAPDPAQALTTRYVMVTLTENTREHEERRRAEDATFAAQLYAESLEMAIEHLTDGVLILDAGGRMRTYNRAALSYAANYRAVEEARMRGGRVAPEWLIFDESGTPVAEGDLPGARAMMDGAPVTGVQMVLRRESGEDVPVMVSAAPLFDEGGHISGAIIIFHDMRALKEIERMKDEFISIASHELRQPLTVIQGQAQMLRRHLSRMRRAPLSFDGEVLQTLVEGVESQTGRLNGLVSDLLDMSRIQIGQLQLERLPTAVLPLVRHVLRQQRDVSLNHHLTLTTDLPPDFAEPVGVWDERRIEQVLMNLLSNAIKYSPAGGEVTMTVGVAREGQLATDGGRPRRVVVGPAMQIAVRDQGIGIPDDALDHLFERFYRAGNTAGIQGTGLGLYICRQIAWGHGGDLWAESHGLGRGTTFHLTLPLLGDEPVAQDE